ncbi:hypothetical protein HD806DRAFT_525530 [Xylariaceae sp. AK1471]|nr:hypothetical protein HD806DRAFT_525530 [Xylariaceae sp. AK1471]
MNVRPTSWTNLLPAILKALNHLKIESPHRKRAKDSSVVVVSREEWLRRLRYATDNLTSVRGRQDSENINPAARLWETENAATASSTLQQLDSISHRNLEKWIKMWFRDGKAYA